MIGQLHFLLFPLPVLVFGAARAQLGVAELPSPLPTERPPIPPIPTILSLSKGSVLSIDIHPLKR